MIVHKLSQRSSATKLAAAGEWYAEDLAPQDQRLVAGWLRKWGAIDIDSIDSRWVKANLTDPRLTEVSPGRVRRELAIFSAMLNFAHRAGLKQDPVWIQRPTVDDARLVWLTRAQRDAMIAAAEPLRFKAVVSFLFNTGARLGEALGTTQADVQSGCVEFVSRKGRGKVVHRRSVPLRHNLAALLAQSLTGYDGPLLLPDTKGGRWSDRSVQRHWARLRDSLGHGPEVVPHVARHTFTSLLIQSGRDPLLVAKLTGHRDQRSLSRYTHLDTGALINVIAEA